MNIIHIEKASNSLSNTFKIWSSIINRPAHHSKLTEVYWSEFTKTGGYEFSDILIIVGSNLIDSRVNIVS